MSASLWGVSEGSGEDRGRVLSHRRIDVLYGSARPIYALGSGFSAIGSGFSALSIFCS